jgi:hypothetical protein
MEGPTCRNGHLLHHLWQMCQLRMRMRHHSAAGRSEDELDIGDVTKPCLELVKRVWTLRLHRGIGNGDPNTMIGSDDFHHHDAISFQLFGCKCNIHRRIM